MQYYGILWNIMESYGISLNLMEYLGIPRSWINRNMFFSVNRYENPRSLVPQVQGAIFVVDVLHRSSLWLKSFRADPHNASCLDLFEA